MLMSISYKKLASRYKIIRRLPLIPFIFCGLYATVEIPINTLGAVNKFLENNVPARKKVDRSDDEDGEGLRVRRGPHARKRANKEVVIIKEDANMEDSE